MNSTRLSAIAAAIVFGICMCVQLFANKTNALQEQSVLAKKPNAFWHHEETFTPELFEHAQKSNLHFFIAFHKKGCERCNAQKKALELLYDSAEFPALKVLIVDYDDPRRSDQFYVGLHDTLILFKGKREINRSNGLVEALAIKNQIYGNYLLKS